MSDLILRPCLQIVSIGRIRFARIGYGIRIELRFATLARSSSSSSSFENSSLHWSSIVAEVSIILRITARLCICLSLSLSVLERRSLIMFIASLLSIREIVVEGSIRRNANL